MTQASGVPAMPPRPHLSLPSPGTRRAVVIGAGSFGTAVAVLLARGGFRTTLQTRTAEQAERLEADRENRVYLPASSCRAELRIEPAQRRASRARTSSSSACPRAAWRRSSTASRAPGCGPRRRSSRCRRGSCRRDGIAPTVLLAADARRARASPASAARRTRARWSPRAPALVAASTDERLALTLADVFQRAGVVCERSNDPIGVELAGAAKNAAALARRATRGAGAQRRRRRRRPRLLRGVALRGDAGRAAGVADRPGRHRRPRRHRARAAVAQPPRRRAARRGRPGRGDPRAGSARPSSRSTSCRCSTRRSPRRGRGADHLRAGRPDLRRGALDEWVAKVRTTKPPAARFVHRSQTWWRRSWLRVKGVVHAPRAVAEPGLRVYPRRWRIRLTVTGTRPPTGRPRTSARRSPACSPR